jgi:MYXO-CTERM domain-containing protein/uncharacterized protein (TIGR03382 family)
MRLRAGSFFVLAASVSALGPRVAEACSGLAEPPLLLYPQNGETISFDTHFLLRVNPFGRETELRLRQASHASEMMIEIERLQLIDAGTLLVVRPVARLDPSSTFLTVGGLEDTPEMRAQFEPSGSTAIAPPVAPANVRWFDQFMSSESRNSCFPRFTRAFHLEVDSASAMSASTYLAIRVTGLDSTGSSETLDFAAYAAGQTSVRLDQFLPQGFEPSCIAVATVAADGSESAAVSVCQPQKCTLFAPEFEVYADWTNVPDGCALNCTLGQDGYNCEEGPAALGGGLDEAEASCGCRATQGGSSTSWAFVVVIAVLVLRRRAWIVLAALLVLGVEQRAEACSWNREIRPVALYPTTPFIPANAGLLVRGHTYSNWDVEVVRDGDTSIWRVEALDMIRTRDLLLVLTPNLVSTTDEYRIDGLHTDGTRESLLAFRMTDSATIAPPLAPPVAPSGVEWFHQVMTRPLSTSCAPQDVDRAFHLQINFDDPMPASSYLLIELVGRDTNGAPVAHEHAAYGAGAETFELDDTYANVKLDIDCIRVRTMSVDGTGSDPVEVCVPTKCAFFDPHNNPTNPFLDWTQIEGGCTSDGEVIDPNAEVDPEREQPEPETPGLNEAEAENCGCRATQGGSSTSWAFIALLGVLVLRRRAWIVLAALLVLGVEQRAEACSPDTQSPPLLLYPAAPISPTNAGLILRVPYYADWDLEITRNGGPASLGLAEHETVGLALLLVFRSDTSSGAYSVDAVHSNGDTWQEMFEITDTATLAAPIPGAVKPRSVLWFHEPSTDRTTCNSGDLVFRLRIELDEPLPASSFLIINARGTHPKNGQAVERSFAEHHSGAQTIELFDEYYSESFDIECLSVRMASLDGSESEPVETCAPYEEEGGCACTSNKGSSASAWALVAGFALLVLRRRALLVMGVAGSIAIGWSERAEACTPNLNHHVIYPEGGEIAPNAHLLMLGPHTEMVSLVRGATVSAENPGEIVPHTTVSIDSEARDSYQALIIIRPTVPLATSDDYALVARGVQGLSDDMLYGYTFRANSAVNIEPPVTLMTMRWFDQRNLEDPFSNCYEALRVFRLEIDPAQPLAPNMYVRIDIRGRSADGSPRTIEIARPAPEMTRIEVDSELPNNFEPECFSAWVVAADGTAGTPIETCAPNKCIDNTDRTRPFLDWTQAPEGSCNPAPDAGLEAPDAGVTSSADGGIGGEAESSGCRTSEGTASPVLFALLAIIAVRRRSKVRQK